MSSRLAHRSTLRVEKLEDRATPAVWNNPWPEPERLTMSFATDGTKFEDGAESGLFARLGQQMTTLEWQGEFLRAAQTWAAAAGLNVSVVKDEGKPFGEAGPVQGSPWFGDIRVSARPLADTQIAVATPFDMLDNAAGDIVVNSTVAFNRGGAGGAHDLYTVALQEVGHALGLPNSADPASVMYTQYTGVRTGLSAGDVAAIRSLYGARTADRLEGSGGNNTQSSAKTLKFVTDADQLAGTDGTAGSDPYVAAGDVTTSGDVDFYTVKLPSGQKDFFVELRTGGLSSFVGRVSIYSSSGVLVKSAAAADPQAGDLSVFHSGASGATYRVKVEAANPAAFATGAYRLAVGKEAHEAVFPKAASGWVNPDNGRDDGTGSAKDIGEVKLAGGDRWEFTTRASIESATDRDIYRLLTDKNMSQGVAVLSIWALEAEKLDPVIRVYSKTGTLLPVDVLANDRSTYTVQVTGLVAGTQYYVEVAAADPQGSYKEGNYFLGVDLRQDPVVLTTVSAGNLTAANKQWAGRFEVTQARTYHFNLNVGNAPAAAEAGVRVTIYDAADRAVASFMARAGDTVGTDVDLAPGAYTVKLSAGTKNGAALPTLAYNLRMLVRNDPIGPKAVDPTGTPVTPPTNPPPPPVTIAPSTWAYWVDDYSDPWFGV